MKPSGGLFLKCRRQVAPQFPEVRYYRPIVDNARMQLVMLPESVDVPLPPNLHGDTVPDLAADLVGGLGIVPGANLGDNHAIFEAVHGAAPDIAPWMPFSNWGDKLLHGVSPRFWVADLVIPQRATSEKRLYRLRLAPHARAAPCVSARSDAGRWADASRRPALACRAPPVFHPFFTFRPLY
jgi:hypothetical protein